MKSSLSLLFVLLTFLSGCSESDKVYRVGIDTSWYPLRFDGTETNNITAFSTELLMAIGQVEHLSFIKITTNWDTLMEGLQKRKYNAILSSMPPYLFNQKLFHFSSLYLRLGPVFVVTTTSPLDSLEKLQGKEIAVVTGSSDELLLQKSGGVLIRYYDTSAEALNAVATQAIDGALVDILTATAFLRDLYQQKLKIVTPPLTEEGLRLITKYTESEELTKRFNSGLQKLQENGDYNKLLDKWGLQL